MLSLFRKPVAQCLRVPLLACLMSSAGAASAADAYFIPELNLGGEQHTNIDLNPTENSGGLKQDASGYSALAGAILGWRTQRTVTELRPRAQFYEYPDRDDLSSSNYSVDLNSRSASLRSDWAIVGSYSKRTSYEERRVANEYDEFDPDDPILESASRVTLASETRTRAQVRPSYSYRFTQRIGARIEGVYQNENFGGASSNVDYDYLVASGSLLWFVSQKTQLETGVYGSKYDGEDADEVSAQGITLGLQHSWSPTVVGNASVIVENTTAKNALLNVDSDSTNWGIEVGLVKKGQVSNVRINAGRTFNPSGIGSVTVIDQVRLQYYRSLTQRWTFSGALRFSRGRELGAKDVTDEDRDFASVYTQVGWNVTRTWSVTGGYSYYFRKFISDGTHGDDHVVTLGIAYRGLRPQ